MSGISAHLRTAVNQRESDGLVGEPDVPRGGILCRKRPAKAPKHGTQCPREKKNLGEPRWEIGGIVEVPRRTQTVVGGQWDNVAQGRKPFLSMRATRDGKMQQELRS